MHEHGAYDYGDATVEQVDIPLATVTYIGRAARAETEHFIEPTFEKDNWLGRGDHNYLPAEQKMRQAMAEGRI